MRVLSRSNAAHYVWGDGCDGWRITDEDNLSVIEERMPPRSQETQHFHETSHQLFRVLSGQLTLHIGDDTLQIHAGQAANVPPRTAHQACNTSDCDVIFLVISTPSTRQDRVEGRPRR